MIIAIDGPAGSGKSTIAKLLAKKMNFIYIDSGAAYRAVSYYVLKNNVDLEDKSALENMLNLIHLNYTLEGNIVLNNEILIDEIRTPEVTLLVSRVAAMELIRNRVTDYLRAFSKENSIIMDGRDIGTVVFPNADFKFYFVADPEVRALRRLKDTHEEINEENINKMKDLIMKRDNIDSNRSISPLRKSVDATLIETTKYSIEELVDYIFNFVSMEGKDV